MSLDGLNSLLTTSTLSDDEAVTKAVDKATRSIGRIPLQSELSKLLYGINRKNNMIETPINIENQGYVFFTKPALNLTAANTVSAPRLQYLNDDKGYSAGTAIKCMLMPDPDVMKLVPSTITVNDQRSMHVDDLMAFIPLMGSSIKTLSGWPDYITQYFLYEEGLAKQVSGHADHRPDLNGSFDLTATFRTTAGDFLGALLPTWWEYMGRVAEGSMTPFPVFITERELDYTTRIWRLVLDDAKRFVVKIACTGYSILGGATPGASFNYNEDSIMGLDNDELSAPFKCFGAYYNDPRCIEEFNKTVWAFNPDMHDSVRESTMVKLTYEESIAFNSAGYPRISEVHELEWWLPIEAYNVLING